MRVIIDTEDETLTIIGATVKEYLDHFSENSMENYQLIEAIIEGLTYTDSISFYSSTT